MKKNSKTTLVIVILSILVISWVAVYVFLSIDFCNSFTTKRRIMKCDLREFVNVAHELTEDSAGAMAVINYGMDKGTMDYSTYERFVD